MQFSKLTLKESGISRPSNEWVIHQYWYYPFVDRWSTNQPAQFQAQFKNLLTADHLWSPSVLKWKCQHWAVSEKKLHGSSSNERSVDGPSQGASSASASTKASAKVDSTASRRRCCPECSVVVTSERALVQHLALHNGSIQPSYLRVSLVWSFVYRRNSDFFCLFVYRRFSAQTLWVRPVRQPLQPQVPPDAPREAARLRRPTARPVPLRRTPPLFLSFFLPSFTEFLPSFLHFFSTPNPSMIPASGSSGSQLNRFGPCL